MGREAPRRHGGAGGPAGRRGLGGAATARPGRRRRARRDGGRGRRGRRLGEPARGLVGGAVGRRDRGSRGPARRLRRARDQARPVRGRRRHPGGRVGGGGRTEALLRRRPQDRPVGRGAPPADPAGCGGVPAVRGGRRGRDDCCRVAAPEPARLRGPGRVAGARRPVAAEGAGAGTLGRRPRCRHRRGWASARHLESAGLGGCGEPGDARDRRHELGLEPTARRRLRRGRPRASPRSGAGRSSRGWSRTRTTPSRAG